MVYGMNTAYSHSHQMYNNGCCAPYTNSIYDVDADDDDSDVSSDDGYHGSTPPPPPLVAPPVHIADLDNEYGLTEESRRDSTYSSIDGGGGCINMTTLMYCDVGEEISVNMQVHDDKEIGLTIITCQSFSPNLPAILDIKKNSLACFAEPKIKIGDQIKEINGIPTEGLSLSKLTSLFSSVQRDLQLVLRRGVEPTKREFDWFKFPFSSVSKSSEELVLRCFTETVHESCCPGLKTFQDIIKDIDEAKQRFDDRKVQDGSHHRHFRSLSASATCRNAFLFKKRQRRKTVQETKTTSDLFTSNSLSLLGFTNRNVTSKSIVDEVEMRRMKGRSSQQSLTSASSTTTISSTNSNNEITDVSKDHEEHDIESNKTIPRESKSFINRTPVNKLRDSFRKRIKNKNSSSNDVIHEQPFESTFSVTVWIPDRRKLGIKLGGGSISPYGDNNICIVEVKKTGTAYKLLRPGDEILEIDGKSTNGLDMYQVNDLLKKLEGNFIELKVFRPTKS